MVNLKNFGRNSVIWMFADDTAGTNLLYVEKDLRIEPVKLFVDALIIPSMVRLGSVCTDSDLDCCQLPSSLHLELPCVFCSCGALVQGADR